MRLRPRTLARTAALTLIAIVGYRSATVPAMPVDRDLLERRAAGLDRVVSLVEFNRTPLERALQRLAGDKVDMQVRWDLLEAAGVSRDEPITLRLHNVPLHAALDAVMALGGTRKQLPGGCSFSPFVSTLAWQCDRGRVVVTTGMELIARPELRLYDVGGDLAHLQAHPEQWQVSRTPEDGQFLRFAAPDAGNHLVEVLSSQVASDERSINGGRNAAMVVYGDTLFVSHSGEGHRTLARTLAWLRETR